ncbi:MAG: YbeD family protein [Planctomycetota bacterium]
MTDRRQLIRFPTEFPIKVVCTADGDLRGAIAGVVRTHAPDFDATTISVRESSKGTYHSLTCTIVATSQDQLDELYRALGAHPLVRFVL